MILLNMLCLKKLPKNLRSTLQQIHHDLPNEIKNTKLPKRFDCAFSFGAAIVANPAAFATGESEL